MSAFISFVGIESITNDQITAFGRRALRALEFSITKQIS